MDHVRPFASVEVQEHLGVARRSETVALCFRVTPQFPVVIDLAVEDDDVAGFRVGHGLGTGLGQVDDTHAAVRQTYPTVSGIPFPQAIRPSDRHVVPDGAEYLPIHGRGV